LPRLPASKSSSTRRLALVLKSRCAGFGCDARQRLTGLKHATPVPRWPRRVPQSSRDDGAHPVRGKPERDWLIPLRLRVVRAPGLTRNTGHQRQPTRPSGCPSLWVLSLGHARERTSPVRVKPSLSRRT
jgi:hypothetical protein